MGGYTTRRAFESNRFVDEIPARPFVDEAIDLSHRSDKIANTMKKSLSSTRATLAFVCLGLATPPVFAAPATEVQANPAPVKLHTIRLKNIAPSLMAYWIDPANNAAPPLVQKSLELLGDAPTKPDKAAPNPLMPTGIERITAVDAQNSLVVLGTDAGVQQLEKVVAMLDRPLRQVEIEAQFVQIAPEDARELGFDFASIPTANFKIGFVRGNAHATLARLVKDGKAKILSAPRVTAINNLPASISASTNPIPAESKTLFEFVVTPTINNDNTITLLTTWGKLARPAKNNEKPITPSAIETVVNARDGDTFVLADLPESVSKSFESLEYPEDLLLLLTPRIVRRAGDEAKPD